jgi:twitching motility protein PilT
MSIDFIAVLKAAVERYASDVHIVIGKPPMLRINGDIVPLPDYAPLTAEDSQFLIYSMLFEPQRRRFQETQELDSSFVIPGIARFRVNVLMGRLGMEAVLRVIGSSIPTPKELGFTPAMEELAKLRQGFVLVTGPTGSGKSTTLASIIDLINATQRQHILTIEDPIEFVYESKQSIVRQREVGTTTQSFSNALRAALREDPNVILVGEMRDVETIALAITAAETGHLVFATLQNADAPQAIDRIIDVFPSQQQQQVRIQLSATLRAVICQTLVPLASGKGRIAAREFMAVTPAVSNLIREGKTHMLYSSIETGAKFGMMSLDKSLEELVRSRKVKLDDALLKARDQNKIRTAFSGTGY